MTDSTTQQSTRSCKAPDAKSASSSYAVERRASDIHLKAGRPPIMRVDGEVRFAGEDSLTAEHVLSFLDEMMSPAQKEEFLRTGDADLGLQMEGVGRFRVNCLKQRGTTAMIMRHIKEKIPDVSNLNMPRGPIEQIANSRRGLVLVTGTTGSGKSTTLAAIIDIINRTRREHIVTLEDPIEYMHQDKLSSVIQREMALDTKDFKTALRALMREDPDVILIGEMRDEETFAACISAAETGHLVFSTLHTTNAMLTIDRILDLFPPTQHQQVRSQISSQLRAILSQRLLPSLDGVGRVPALEILFNTPAVAGLIRDNNLRQIPSAINAGQGEGMQSFNMSLTKLVQDGLIGEAEAMAASDNADELKMNLQGIFLSQSRGGILKR